LKWVA